MICHSKPPLIRGYVSCEPVICYANDVCVEVHVKTEMHCSRQMLQAGFGVVAHWLQLCRDDAALLA